MSLAIFGAGFNVIQEVVPREGDLVSEEGVVFGSSAPSFPRSTEDIMLRNLRTAEDGSRVDSDAWRAAEEALRLMLFRLVCFALARIRRTTA